MSANPIANGGLLRKPSTCPISATPPSKVKKPGATLAGNVPVLGNFLRDVMRLNMQNFRVFGPDETQSNRLQALYEVTKKAWLAEYFPEDADGGNLAPDGRVMEMLSEHTVEGWLEGYILSGRHGLLNSYESFVHVIDSMFNQHAKWLEKCNELPWRAKVSSLNLLITALVWRQDHNGFTHQDPGFLDVVANKSPSVVRIYLPPDANCLLSVADHCLRSVNYINVIVADKQVHLQYLDMDAAIDHCTKGVGIWNWASNDQGAEPDVVMASCGDVPTMESLAATALLRQHLPDVKVRFVNVVDLFKLVPNTEHPHGLTDREFEALFTPDKPVVFNFHAYPWLIHRLTYRRPASTTSTCAATRSRAISTRRWNWRSATRPTASAWPSTRSTACHVSASLGRALARPCSTSRSRARTTRTSSASTRPKSPTGSGRSEGVHHDQ